MKRLILTALLLLIVFVLGYAQSKKNHYPKAPVRLTKEQMYADYDQFVDIIKNYNAQWEIRKEHTSYDLMAILQNRRSKIDSIRDYWKFISFLDNSLLYLLDNHADRTSSYFKVKENRFAPGQRFYKSKKITKISDGFKKYAFMHYSSDTLSPTFQTMAAQYIHGEYYMLASFLFANRHIGDSICFKNARVIACDNMPVDDYVRKKMIGILPPYHIRWDFDENKYYTDLLMIDYSKPLMVENENGEIFDFIPGQYPVKSQTLSIDSLSSHLDEFFQNYKQRERQFARYFEEEKILYVYLEMMRYQRDCNVIDTIRLIAKEKPLEKIVIDVRGNEGGGDGFWMDLLSAIVKDTLTVQDKIALNANDPTIHFFKSEYPSEMVDEYEYMVIPFLDNKKMFVHSQFGTIDPDTNTLGFDGPIYILQDEKTFSSGHSFSSFAKHVEQLISVGIPTGDMVGFGFNPWHFQLDNSLYTFHFEPAIDLSGAERWEDTFQCTPEIVIWPTIEELIDYKSYRYLMSIKDFLFTKDYLFQKVLELE